LAIGLLDLINRDDARLKLNDPVVLSVADGMVYQKGFAIPLGGEAKFEIEGLVGFDKSLNLRAGLPLTAEMAPKAPLIGQFIDGLRIGVPIGGTLDNPKIDKEAFREGAGRMAQSLAQRGVMLGINGLFELLNRSKDPNAPPPPPRLTPAERRANRLQKKMERQAEKQKRSGRP
jgi:translocation and assembly module TamB